MDIEAEAIKEVKCKCGKRIDTSKGHAFQAVKCPQCGKLLTVPGRIGDIVLLKELGKGAMGVVFRGIEQNLGRSVAVKVLKREKSNKENQERIELTLAEARSLASLNHPNVVQVFSIDLAQSNPYIVMELVDGGRLDEMIKKQGVIDEAHALEIAIEVAEGLNAALGVGLVHGDVKPANILLDKQGICKLIDFGIAHSLDDKDGPEFLGTPYFVAPEIVRREQIDHRADIFSLGVTLFHALTGKRPYSGDNVKQIIRARMDAPAPSIREVIRQLHPRTAQVVARMLERQTLDRHQTYDDLITDLAEALGAVRLIKSPGQQMVGTQPIPAANEIGQGSSTQTQSDKKRLPVKLIAGAVLIVMIGLGGGAWLLNVFSKPVNPDHPIDPGGTTGTSGSLPSGPSGAGGANVDLSRPDHFFSFTSFAGKNSAKLLQVNGDAQIKRRQLVLTEDKAESRGSVFYRKPVQLSQGFMTWFRFKINSGTGKPGDGFAFIIQNDSPKALGSKGGGLGYAADTKRKTQGPAWKSAIKKGVAVEFDTFAGDPKDPAGIAIHTSSGGVLNAAGDRAIGGVAKFPFKITDGKTYLAAIRYDLKSHNIFINLFDTANPARNVSRVVRVPLTKSVFDKNGRAWVGFSAGTGGESEAHQILGWSFASARVSHLSDGLLGQWKLDRNTQDTSGTRANGKIRGTPNLAGSPMVGMGPECEVEWKGGWYPAEVLETGNNRWLIRFPEDNDTWKDWVGKNRIRFREKILTSAYELDGVKDFIEIGDPQGLHTDRLITMAAWIKPQADRGKKKISGHRNILARSSAGKREVYLRIGAGHYQVGVWDGKNHGTSWPIPVSDFGKWVHLAGVYDGSAWRLYRNGLEVSSAEGSVGAINFTGGWAIGRSGTKPERFFRGAIDNVHLYKRALKPGEIMWLALMDLRP
jgi:serine/threonine protein kinase